MTRIKHAIVLEKEWEAHGLLCRATINTLINTRCGYVRVGKDHPFYRVNYDQPVPADIDKARMLDMLEDPPFATILAAASGDHEVVHPWLWTLSAFIRVHGDITFSSDHHPADPKAVPGTWWFGWDAAHPGDYCPWEFKRFKTLLKEVHDFKTLCHPEALEDVETYARRVEAREIERDFVYEGRVLLREHYWTLEEVIHETEKMAKQLSVVGMLGNAKDGRQAASD